MVIRKKELKQTVQSGLKDQAFILFNEEIKALSFVQKTYSSIKSGFAQKKLTMCHFEEIGVLFENSTV